MTWNISPEIFSMGAIQVRWYGLLFACAFLIGSQILFRIFRMEGKSENDANSLVIYMVVGVILGSRLGHCIFYEPAYYFRHPLQMLMVWKGGLASHGAAVGMMVALYLFIRRRSDESFLWLADRLSVPIALGGSFVRFGNFFNSEILGKPTDVPWAITFSRIDSLPRHPSQLYEAILLVSIFVLLFALYERYKTEIRPGLLFGLLLTCLFSVRFFLEFLKTNQEAFHNTLPINMGQILSIPMVLLGLYLLFFGNRKERSSE